MSNNPGVKKNSGKKKKMSLTQFFLIYILLLALILVGVGACSAAISKSDIKKLEPETSPIATANSEATPAASPAGSDPTEDVPGETPTEAPGNDPQPGEATAVPGNDQPTAEPAPTAEPQPTQPVTGTLTGLKVAIDAGHSANPPSGKETLAPWSTEEKAKNTSGTSGATSGKDEYEVNLEIALKIRDTLAAQGAEVIMTRTTNDVSLSNQQRAAISNDNNVHAVISIHCNGADSTEVRGLEVYSRGSGDGSGEYKERSVKEAALASKLAAAVCDATGAVNRGAKLSDSYTGINYSKAPCFILECGFMSNPEEDTLLASSEYQQKIAVGILNFLTASKDSLLA